MSPLPNREEVSDRLWWAFHLPVRIYFASIFFIGAAIAAVLGVITGGTCLGPHLLWVGLCMLFLAVGLGSLGLTPALLFLAPLGGGIILFGYISTLTGHC